jgi:cytochrome c-type biogenesis protein CcmH/NrfG/predicted aspartyl protease
MFTNVKLMRLGTAFAFLTLVLVQYAPAASGASEDPSRELKLGATAIRKGHYSDAIAHYEKAIHRAPGHVGAQLGLSWALLKERRYLSAAEQALKVLDGDPQNARALGLLGMALMRGGLLAEAEAAFVRAFTSNRDEPLAMAGLAEVSLYRSDFVNSLYGARRAVSLSPREPDFLYLLAQAAARQERFDEAAQAFEEFLSCAPDVDKERRDKIRGLIDLYRRLNGIRLYGFDQEAPVEVPFDLSDRQLPVVEVMVNGKGPFRFVIDTGSGFVVISERTAQALGTRPIARGGVSQGVGGGGSFPIVYGLLRRLEFGSLRVDNVPAYIRKFHGESGAAVDGFIGVSLLSRFSVVVDFGTRRFGLRPRQTEPEPPAPGDLVVPYRMTTGGMMSVPTELATEGPELHFIVDTGASATVVSQDTFSRLNLADKLDKRAQVRVVGAGGITEDVPVVVLDRLTVRGHRRDFVRAIVLDLAAVNETAGFQQAGIIGNNVLRHYRLEIDFARSQLILRPVTPTPGVVGAPQLSQGAS